MLIRYYTPGAHAYAGTLRRNQTPEERHLWYDFLRYQRPRFHRQLAIGNYIVDFACMKSRLVVELDGGQHYDEATMAYDDARTAFLQSQGYRVLRFINSDIRQHFNDVCATIERAMCDSSIAGRINSQ